MIKLEHGKSCYNTLILPIYKVRQNQSILVVCLPLWTWFHSWSLSAGMSISSLLLHCSPCLTAHPRSHRAAGWICGRSLSMMWASLHDSGWASSAPSGGPGGEQSTAAPADAAKHTASSAAPPLAPAAAPQPAGSSHKAGLERNTMHSNYTVSFEGVWVSIWKRVEQ